MLFKKFKDTALNTLLKTMLSESIAL